MKKMKHLTSLLMAVQLLGIVSCSSENPTPDCGTGEILLEIVGVVDVKCASTGSLSVSVTGGEAPYQYSLDGVSFQDNNSFDNLSQGNYTITVKDDRGCKTTIAASIGFEGGDVVGEVVSTTSTNCGGSGGAVSFAASGGDGSYQYRIDGGQFTTSETFEMLTPGAHSFAVQDGEGCSDEGSFVVLSNTSLENDVLPIITKNCAVSGCHENSQSPLLNTKNAIIANANNIEDRTSAGTMPPPDRDDLSQSEIELIACWVNDGAPDN